MFEPTKGASAQDLELDLAETHISVLVFWGDRAYKAAKPVAFAFIDQSTPAIRRQALKRELLLNRRLAPDVYLRVLDVRDSEGELVDAVLEMRRMPSERRLSTLLARGDRRGHEGLEQVARKLAAFHEQAAVAEDAERLAGQGALRSMWESNLKGLEPFEDRLVPRSLLADVTRLAHAYIDGRGPLFEQRIEHGLIRDGHGDVLADDIFVLDDGPRILDCLAFDDDLRTTDVLADVAFLVMDLQRLGHVSWSVDLIRWYQEFTAELHPASLAHFYVAHRALVRAKVACLSAVEPGDEHAGEANALLAICRRHLQRAAPRLVLVGGEPGSGKSTLAQGLSDQLGWSVLRSDVERKELAGLSSSDDASAPVGEGIYRPDMTAATYDVLLSKAGALLSMGESVILDASWQSRIERARARNLAMASCTELAELRCEAPAQVTGERLLERELRPDSASDATMEVAKSMHETFDAWPEAEPIRTDRDLRAEIDEAIDVVGGRWPLAPTEC
ncbi:MAG: hypothetical protein JJLCMIEE_02990 [Acidimicrobiales bacterium]|nr:MAG: gluconate kinase [Actinomycetota bacterium]MBV6509877.1 hypothetical protein [Acidimicrobiales bacterium]RIK06186.1 MAG: gluconate kinase [Acidobacteriota bacterium]